MKNQSSPPPRARGFRTLMGLGLASAAALGLVATAPLILQRISADASEENAKATASAPTATLPDIAATPLPQAEQADRDIAHSLVPAVGGRDAATRKSADVAQTLSPYCQTPQGVCTLPVAQMIGTPCNCNSTPGTIVP